MAEQVFENIRKATESAIQSQQEMLRKWAGFWTGLPASQGGSVVEQVQAIQKKWAEALAELFQKQRETLQAQFNAGLKSVEDASRVLQAKDAEQFRAKAVNYWQNALTISPRPMTTLPFAFTTSFPNGSCTRSSRGFGVAQSKTT